MLKFIVLVTVALAFVFFLPSSEGKRAGFCFKKINSKTGECRSKMEPFKQEKVDCCSNGGAGWSAKKRDKASCEPCRTTEYEKSYWSVWGDWSDCNATCGPSFRVSRRECISKGKKTCKGKNEKSKSCPTGPCPIDGGWSPWGNWSLCSVTCEKGLKIRSRTCTNPVPQYGGKDCQGLMENSTSCMENEHCPIHGGWGEWGDYSVCSMTCGLGKRFRERKCDSPKPQYGGRPCNETNKQDFKYCREQKICKDIPEISGSGSWDSDESGSGSGSGSGSSGFESGGWGMSSGQKAWSDDEDY